jgi:hypothetical protein
MRRLASVAVLVAAGSLASPARASGPDPAAAIAVGAATVLAGFAVGGTFIAASAGSARRTEAGWFVMEGGLSMAPLLAHGAVGEWGRGGLFAAVPTATTLASVPVFLVNGAAVEQGSVGQQRTLWSLFCGSLAASMAGILDAAFAPGRAVHVLPILGAGNAGLLVAGAL